VIGWSTNDANEPNERFLDVRAAARTTVMDLIGKRIQLAKKIGCDAVLAHKTFMGAPFDSGFTHTPAETLSFHADVAALAHTPADDTQIAIGMHNGYNGPSSDADLIDVYEFQIMEGLAAARQCCDDVRASINADHAAFALDVLSDDPDFPVTKEIACDQYDQGGMQDGLIKDALLSSTVREVCTAAKPRR
jgi:hypothetical protein